MKTMSFQPPHATQFWMEGPGDVPLPIRTEQRAPKAIEPSGPTFR